MDVKSTWTIETVFTQNLVRRLTTIITEKPNVETPEEWLPVETGTVMETEAIELDNRLQIFISLYELFLWFLHIAFSFIPNGPRGEALFPWLDAHVTTSRPSCSQEVIEFIIFPITPSCISSLSSPESEIKMEDKYIPVLCFGLGAIVPIAAYGISFVLGNWQKSRCRCCVLHDLASSERSGYGDTDHSPDVDLSVITTKPNPARSVQIEILPYTTLMNHSSIRNMKAATIQIWESVSKPEGKILQRYFLSLIYAYGFSQSSSRIFLISHTSPLDDYFFSCYTLLLHRATRP